MIRQHCRACARSSARVKPRLVCEVRFLSWTSDGLLRQVAYEDLRADKAARDVRRERPA